MAPQNDTPWWDTDRPTQNDTPWWDPDDTTPPPQMDPVNDPPHQIPRMETWRRILYWANNNIHTVIYMGIGLLLAIGILNIGFWRTFLVALCLGIGYILGSWHDGNPRFMQKLKRFSQRFIDDNPFMK